MEKHIKKHCPFIIFIFIINGHVFGQKINFGAVEDLLNTGKNYSAIKLLDHYEQLKNSEANLAKIYYYHALALSNESVDDKAFQYYINSKKKFLAIDSLEAAMKINLDIASLLSSQKNQMNIAKTYVQEYLDFAKKNNNRLLLAKGYEKWGSCILDDQPRESLNFYKAGIAANNASKNKALSLILYNNIGVVYNEKLQNPDSALFYYKKAALFIENRNPNDICSDLINRAGCYYYKAEYAKALALLKKADAIKLTKNISNTKLIIYSILSLNYEGIGDYKNAYLMLYESNQISDTLLIEKQNLKISELNILYNTQKKELENLALKNNIKIKNIFLYSVIGLIIILILISILTYKNLQKKKKIAEQSELIQIQKLEKTLRDQELHEIDVMLESQEKERQRLANELHDNLGSMLATLKLNFQNLKSKAEHAERENKLYDKTDELIEEAYQKVRNISHLKNLGVVASEGLLSSVNKMASKMSVPEKLTINVIPFGLTERLENTLEITLFRIIQELCTNIIKHSGANEVNIYLTQHSTENLNIMIEDNGNGFDPKTLADTDGIGLKSIEKKVEQMGGNFTIDSILSKGTTIIIDLNL
ncbi:MAG: ATP-binding protein [Flavobacterium sp.]|nr:ATP-binding protein [Flavobacterium sp.]